MAKRIQRKRTKGWRMPAGTIYVGRPTKWGNPWKPGGSPWPLVGGGALGLSAPITARDAKHAVELYRRRLMAMLAKRFITAIELQELHGKDLACWCPLDQPCHADVLIEMANDR